jgi:hypothetical protein
MWNYNTQMYCESLAEMPTGFTFSMVWNSPCYVQNNVTRGDDFSLEEEVKINTALEKHKEGLKLLSI